MTLAVKRRGYTRLRSRLIAELEKTNAVSEANATLASFDDARHRSVSDGGRFAAAQEDQPGSSDRPKKGDLLVVSEGERVGAIIAPDDVKLGEPPLHAWPKDPKTSVVRNGSRLNEILVIRLDPGEMDEATRSRSARGHRSLFGHLYSHRMFCHRLAEVRDGRQRRSQVLLSQFRIQSAGRRASRVRARAPASAGTPAGNSRRLAHHSCNIRWKGRCSTTRVMGRGRIGFPCPK